MKKALLFLLFFNCYQNYTFAQKEFTISNGIKNKDVKQTNFFSFNLKNGNSAFKNRISEGYLLTAVDKNYLVDVFLEEYETQDSLVLKRCNVKQRCQKEINLKQDEIEFFQHNNTTKVSGAKFLFGLSAVSILTTTYFALQPSLFEKDGRLDSKTQTIATGITLGIASASFVFGIKLLNPKKYYTSKERKKGGWYIEGKK